MSLAASLVDWAKRNKIGIEYLFVNSKVYQLDGMTLEEEADFTMENLARLRNNIDKSEKAFPEMEVYCEAEETSACFAIFNHMNKEREEFVKNHHHQTRILTVNPKLKGKNNIQYIEHHDVLNNLLRNL